MEKTDPRGDLLAQLSAGDEPLIVHFASQSCAVCQAILPRLHQLATEYGIGLLSIDVAENPEIAGQMLVFTVPTVLLLWAGRELTRESRFVDFGNLERMLSLIRTEEEESR